MSVWQTAAASEQSEEKRIQRQSQIPEAPGSKQPVVTFPQARLSTPSCSMKDASLAVHRSSAQYVRSTHVEIRQEEREASWKSSRVPSFVRSLPQ